MLSAASYGSLKQPTSLTIAGNGTFFSASYNNNGALASASLKKGTTNHYSAAYTYDDVGNIAALTGTVPPLNAVFGYDELNRLTSVSYTGGKSYTYAYDTYGNLTVAGENNSTIFSAAYNNKNQSNTAGFYYDTRGNLTARPGFVMNGPTITIYRR